MEEVINYLREILRKDCSNSAKWQIIKEYLLCNRQKCISLGSRLIYIKNSMKVYDILLELMETFNCDDKVLVHSMTDILTIFLLDTEYFYTARKRTVSSIIENIANETEKSVFPENEGKKILTALNVNHRLMKILLKYGLVASPPEESSFFMSETKAIINDLILTICRSNELNMNDRWRLMNDVRFLNNDNFANCINSEKRMFLAALGVRAIMLYTMMKSEYSSNYIKSMRIYFSAIPDVFVTVSEVRNLLSACFINVNGMDLQDKYLKMYKKIMPESAEMYQPRKLTELSRIQARHYLQANGSLPLAIENSLLPKRLKMFLQFNSIIEDKNLNKRRKRIR